MTERQKDLIQGEIQRHMALAMSSSEPVIYLRHMEVAAALSDAINEENKSCQKTKIHLRLWSWVHDIALYRQLLHRRAREAIARKSSR